MPRILIYVQHLMGIGHLRRAAAVARASASAGAEVVCVSGGYPVPDLDLGQAKLAQLPPAKARDLSYKALVDASSQPVDDMWRRSRVARLLDIATDFAPHVIVTETFPFGRRLLRFELEPLLDWSTRAQPRPKLVASVRDILEGFPGPAGRMAKVVATLQAHYDRVLVHADPQWVVLEDTFPAADQLTSMVEYSGYVNSGAGAGTRDACLAPADAGLVLVSTGGGAVGAELATVALEGARSGPGDWRWLVLLGHNLPDEAFTQLRTLAPSNVRVERNRADFVALLKAARVSVSQAGYNTVCDLLSVDTPAVLVPFESDGQFEQTHRARLLAARGRAKMAALKSLTPDLLVELIGAARIMADAGPANEVGRRPAALDGARASAEYLMALAAC